LAVEQQKLLSHDRPATYSNREYGELRSALELTPSQVPAWQKLLETEHAWAELHLAKPEDAVNQSVLERDATHLAHLRADVAHMQARMAAVRDLYTVFTADQKLIFDDFHAVLMAGRRGLQRGPLRSVASCTAGPSWRKEAERRSVGWRTDAGLE
jgi:hypothetical protein